MALVVKLGSNAKASKPDSLALSSTILLMSSAKVAVGVAVLLMRKISPLFCTTYQTSLLLGCLSATGSAKRKSGKTRFN